MKRILVLVLALILAVSCMAVPSYAAESLNTFFDVLSYSTVDNSGSNFGYVTPEKNSFFFDLPFYSDLYHVDIVVRTDFPVQSVTAGNNTSLTVSPISTRNGYLYRIYGSLNGYKAQRLVLYFSGSFSGAGGVNFHSFMVSTLPLGNIQTTAYGYLSAAGEWEEFVYSPGNQGPSVSIDVPVNELNYGFSAGFNLSQWRLFDYIDVSCSLLGVGAITSITASFVDENGDDQGTYVPIEYSFVGPSFYRDGEYELIIRVDLRDVVRSSTDQLILNIHGEHGGNYIDFYLEEVSGGIVSTFPDPFITMQRNILSAIVDFRSSVVGWLTETYNTVVAGFNSVGTSLTQSVGWLTETYNTVVAGFNQVIQLLSGEGDTEGFQDDVDQQGDKLDQMDEALNSVTKPALDRVDTNISGIVSDTDLANTAHVYTYIIDDNIMAPALTMVTILAMMSFALFGKR